MGDLNSKWGNTPQSLTGANLQMNLQLLVSTLFYQFYIRKFGHYGINLNSRTCTLCHVGERG